MACRTSRTSSPSTSAARRRWGSATASCPPGSSSTRPRGRSRSAPSAWRATSRPTAPTTAARKAVYAYAREDLAWWEAEIRRPIEPASFGENLTLAGVDVTGARIGERWRIGSVELQVSELRKLVTSAGFRDVRVLIVVASARYPSPAELVRWEAAASPLAGPLGALSTPTRDALVADVAAAIADRLDDDGVLLAQETHVVLARR